MNWVILRLWIGYWAEITDFHTKRKKQQFGGINQINPQLQISLPTFQSLNNNACGKIDRSRTTNPNKILDWSCSDDDWCCIAFGLHDVSQQTCSFFFFIIFQTDGQRLDIEQF